MELLVATWTLRLALVGALAVAAISVSAGATMHRRRRARRASPPSPSPLLGRLLIGWLETPEQRMLRLRRRREAARRTNGTAPGEAQARKARPPATERRTPAVDGAGELDSMIHRAD